MELKIAGLTWLPFVRVISKVINGNKKVIIDEETLLGNIMSTLSQQLNLSYTFADLHNLTWGTKVLTTKNLKFDGTIGMLQEDQIDLALGPFALDRGDRYLVADPSVILIEDLVTILSSRQIAVFTRTLGFKSLINSFEANVWYTIMFTLFSIILIFSIAKYIWVNKVNKTTNLTRKPFNEILMRNIYEYSGNLLKQYNRSNSQQLLGVLKACWNLTSYLLIFFYSSMVLVYLIASNKKFIDTIDDLLNAEVMITTEQNTGFEITISEGKTEAFKRIYSQMVEKGIHNCLLTHQEVFSKEIMSAIILGKRALIYSLYIFKSYLSNLVQQKGRCGFYLAESVIEHVPLFILYNKKFNLVLKEKIDSILLEIFERKPFDKKINNYYMRYEECLVDKTNSDWKPLILFNIRGLLLVCMIIITLAFIALFIEIKINNKKQRDKDLKKDPDEEKETTISLLLRESFNVLQTQL